MRFALDSAVPHAPTHDTIGSTTPAVGTAHARRRVRVGLFTSARLMQLLRTWGLTLAWAALIVTVTVMPATAIPSAPPVPGADKLVHAGLFGVLTWLALQARARDHTVRLPLWVLVVSIAIFAGADEWLQQFVPGRAADLLDWVADMAGTLIAAAIFTSAPLRREMTS